MFRRIAVIALLAAACGGTVEDEFEASEDTLSTSADGLVSLRRDFRRCMAPLCGGYWVRDVNARTAERYVNGLDFSNSGLDDATIGLVLDAPTSEIVLKGRLGRLERAHRTRPFVVAEAWRGLPGFTGRASDGLYDLSFREPQITCITAPCPNLVAHKVRTRSRKFVDGLVFATAEASHVDPLWLEGRVLSNDALVLGAVVRGQRFAGGFESLVEARQVFVKLPEVAGPCPTVRAQRCAAGWTGTFERTADRCLDAAGCVEIQACEKLTPACEDGFTLESWNAQPDGCPAYTCTPAWAAGQ